MIGHRIDYNGVGVRRGQRHISSKNWPKNTPPPPVWNSPEVCRLIPVQILLARAMISEGFPLITVGLQEITRSVAVFVLILVAPAPTGSSTHTFPSSRAFVAALCMDFIHGEERVPIFTRRADDMATNSSTSSSAVRKNKDFFLFVWISAFLPGHLWKNWRERCRKQGRLSYNCMHQGSKWKWEQTRLCFCIDVQWDYVAYIQVSEGISDFWSLWTCATDCL